MNGLFPKTDISQSLGTLIIDGLEDPAMLAKHHRFAEEIVKPYSLIHASLRYAAASSLHDPSTKAAVDTGVQLFESIGGIAQHGNHEHTSSLEVQVLAKVATMQFVTSVKEGDDFLKTMEYATARMRHDTPVLHATLDSLAESRANGDPLIRNLTLGSAAIARSMQIYINNRIFEVMIAELELD